MNDKGLDKLFREELKDRSVPPRADLWEGIACRLDGQKTVRPVRFGWVKYAAVFIASLGITAVAFEWLRPDGAKIPPVVAPISEETAKKTMEIPSDRAERSKKGEQTVVETEKKLPKNREKIHRPEGKPEKAAAFSRTDADAISPKAETKAEIPLKPGKPILLARLEMARPAFSSPEGMETAELPDLAPLWPSIALAEAETEPTFPEREDTGLVPGLLNRIAAALALNEHKTLRISRDAEGSVRLEIAKNH